MKAGEMQYLGEYWKMRAAFKDEHKAEDILTTKKPLTKKEFEELQKLLTDELKSLSRFTDLIFTSWKREIEDLLDDNHKIRKAAELHEIPKVYAVKVSEIEEALISLGEVYLHSIHVMIDQIDNISKKSLDKLAA